MTTLRRYRRPTLERQTSRIVPVEVQFRALKGNEEGQFTARVINYDRVDDYGTAFAPKVFTESMNARLPRIVWGHDWTDPIGRWIDYQDGRRHLDLLGELDLALMDGIPAVPRARQALTQLRSGTIDQFSVGFLPMAGEEKEIEGQVAFRFTQARLDEVSLVLVGAVPDTKTLSVRSYHFLREGPMMISKDNAAAVLLKLQTGEVDLVEALQLIKDSDSEQEPGEQGPGEQGPGEQGPGQQEPDEVPEATPEVEREPEERPVEDPDPDAVERDRELAEPREVPEDPDPEQVERDNEGLPEGPAPDNPEVPDPDLQALLAEADGILSHSLTSPMSW
jgi:HK97 family phage prohead protease